MRRSVASALVLFIVLALVAVAGLAGYEFLKVKEIEISGAEYFSPEEIAALADIKPNTNILLLDESALRGKIEQNTRLRLEGIERVLPSRVVLHIKERIPVCAIQHAENYLLLDKDATVLESASTYDAVKYPLVTGLSIKEAALGEKLEIGDDYQLRIFRTLISSIVSADFKSGVSEMNLSELVNLSMKIRPDIHVKLGDNAKIEEKFKLISAVIPKLYEMQITAGIIDVSSAASAVWQPPGNGQQIDLSADDTPAEST